MKEFKKDKHGILVPAWLTWIEGYMKSENEPEQAKQWKFTEREAIVKLLKNKKRLIKGQIAVIINIEIVWWLIELGVDPRKITFFSDCKVRTMIADAMGIKNYTFSKWGEHMKKFDLPITNPDFQWIEETREICSQLTKKYYAIITDSAYYHNKTKNLKDVCVYTHLGMIFHKVGTAKVGAVGAIIDTQGPDILKVRNEDGDSIDYDLKDGLPLVPPGKKLDEWKWANDIVAKQLQGYEANTGILSREDTVFDPKGTIVRYTGGNRNVDYNDENFADKSLVEKWNTKKNRDPSLKKKQQGMNFNTKFWTTAKVTDEQFEKGGGEYNKMICSHASSDHESGLFFKYSPAGEIAGTNGWWIKVKDYDDYLKEQEYFLESKTTKLINALKTNAISNSKSTFSTIPIKELSDKWQ